MAGMEFNYALEEKTRKADKWWNELPDITRVAIHDDLFDINENHRL